MNQFVENNHIDVYANIKRLMEQARHDAAKKVNNILVKTYWEIGGVFIWHIQFSRRCLEN